MNLNFDIIRSQASIYYDRNHLITVDITGFNPKSIKTEIKDNKLLVTGKEEVKNEHGSYSRKSFHKTFDLPKDAVSGIPFTSYCNNGQLLVEIPLKSTQDNFLPQIENNGKRITMKCTLPLNNVDPKNVSIVCKDGEVLIRAEEIGESYGRTTKTFYQKRFNLPSNTNLSSLISYFDNNTLAIEAPLY